MFMDFKDLCIKGAKDTEDIMENYGAACDGLLWIGFDP